MNHTKEFQENVKQYESPDAEFNPEDDLDGVDLDSPLEIYEIKAKQSNLRGDIRKVHYKNTFTYQHICKLVAQEHSHLLKAEVQECVELFFTKMLQEMLTEGKGCEVHKFGIFKVRPKRSRLIYSPRSGNFYRNKTSTKFVFEPARILKEYMTRNGRRIYFKVKQQEELIQQKKQELKDARNQQAIAEGWNKDLTYRPLEDLSVEYLRNLERQGKLQERLELKPKRISDSKPLNDFEVNLKLLKRHIQRKKDRHQRKLKFIEKAKESSLQEETEKSSIDTH